MSKVDANDYAAKYGQDALKKAIEDGCREAEIEALSKFRTARDLLKTHQRKKRPTVIQGLARQQDVINIVAASKMGKTWFAHNLSLAVAAGADFLIPEWSCAQGNVVIIDNELHEDTIADRLPFICEKLGYPDECLDRIIVMNLRGMGQDVNTIAPLMTDLKQFKPKLVIFDSLYRLLPKGCSEMDAGAITAVYNTLDSYAARLETAAFALIIHTTKGSQSDKIVTEVGSGSGAFSRATDNHIIIREHETDGLYVIESAARDWKAQDPVVVRKIFPIFEVATGEDPARLKQKAKASNAKPPIELETVVKACSGKDWMIRDDIIAAIQKSAGQGRDPSTAAFNRAKAAGCFKRDAIPNNRGPAEVKYVLDMAAVLKLREAGKLG